VKVKPDRRTSKVWQLDREYWVYRHVAADGSVLYVGCTIHKDARQATHARTSAWFPLVAEIVYEGPFEREPGFDRETEQIHKFDPPHNFVGTSRYVFRRADVEALREEAMRQAS
jgi:hypothetical protein